MESNQEVLKILRLLYVIREGHFVYTSGLHGPKYVDKDKIYPNPEITDKLCQLLAKEFMDYFKEVPTGVVVAPAMGGINLSQGVARHLTKYINNTVRAAYVEKEEIILPMANLTDRAVSSVTALLDVGDQLIIKKKRFVFKRGYDKMIPGSTILVVEDIITTGGTVKGVLEVVRQLDGKIVGVGALCNRGGLKAEDFGDIGRFKSLVNFQLESWPEEECPMCRDKVPVNTEVGKGNDFLQRRKLKK
ncbi:MAG: phosphoribosyltransferase family protein [Patescibacteria group bacterium]